MQIKSGLTIYLTWETGGDFAERTGACESVIISVVQLLQTWGFSHWNLAHRHFLSVVKGRCSRRCISLCIWFRAWFRHLDAYPAPEHLGWRSVKSWCLKTLRSLLPDLENIVQSGSKWWSGEEVGFAAVSWKLSWWAFPPSLYILTCYERAVWGRGGTWSSGLS